MHKAVDDMATRQGFHGYGPEQGYEWLRHTIAENDYRAKGLNVADDEVFVSDGSKCDAATSSISSAARTRSPLLIRFTPFTWIRT